MPTPIRYTILTQLKSYLETITVANGYYNTVASVEILARGFDDPALKPTTLPWIGIIPQEETIADEPNMSLHCEWAMDLLAHVVPASATALGVCLACEKIMHDIRKCLYTPSSPALGIEEVIDVKMKSKVGSEGSEEAARISRASIQIRIVVEFMDGITDS